jgi:hypothetical protein
MARHEVLPERLSAVGSDAGTAPAAGTAHAAGLPLAAGPTQAAGPPWSRRVAVVAGVMMLAGAGLNTYLVIARPESYAAMGSWFEEVSPWSLGPAPELWAATFGEHPHVWVPLVGIGFEVAVGALALSRNPRRRVVGLTGVAVFHTALLGMGLWAWALPWLSVLVPTIVVTARSVSR